MITRQSCPVIRVLIMLLGFGSMPAVAQENISTGTAFIVDADGYLLTCAHVVNEAANVEVVVGDKVYDATVLAVSEKRDLALLQIKAKDLPALPLGNSNEVQLGQHVWAFGFPLASTLGTTVKVTGGVVSGIETKETLRVFQIDVPVNPGNSGGPLVNDKGQVIGVVNAKLVGAVVSDVGFSVPVNYTKSLIRDEGAEFSTEGATEKLDSSALTKRVTPAVALVRVTSESSSPRRPPPETSPELLRTLAGHTGRVQSVAFSPDGKTLASASDDRTVRLWDVRTGAEKLTYKGHYDSVLCVAFSPDGKTVASGSMDSTVRIWHAETGDLVRMLRKFGDRVWSVAFSPDGKTLASGSFDDTVKLWDTRTGTLMRTLDADDAVRSVAFSPDGKTVAAVDYDKALRVWDTQTGTVLHTMDDAGMLTVAFSPDGSTIASAGWVKGIHLWDAQTGALIRSLDHSSDSVAFSRDGKTLVAEGYDQPDYVLFLFDTQNGALKHTLLTGQRGANSVAFSPDAKTVASGSDDKTIRLWDVSGK